MAQVSDIAAATRLDAAGLNHRKAILLLVLACLFWGISFPVSKALTLLYLQSMPGASSWFVVSLQGSIRFLLAGLLMLPFGWRELPSLREREVIQGVGLGLCGGAGMLFQMDGLAYTSASISAFLTKPIASFCRSIISHATGRHPDSAIYWPFSWWLPASGFWPMWIGVRFRIGRGELSTLVSASFFTFQILWLERPVFRPNRTRMVSTTMFLSMGLIFGLAALCTRPERMNYATAIDSFPKIFLTFLLVFFCTLLAFNLMNHCQPAITSTEAGIVYTTEPLFTTVFALFLPAQLSVLAHINYANERFSLAVVSGGGLILLANLLLQIRGRKAIPPVER